MLDRYVTLGRSGLRVSPFCLGTMTFGEDWGWGASEAESARILDCYLDRGGNFIDTANFYTKGHAERILGDLVGASPARRRRAVLATKFFSNLWSGDPNGGGAGRKSIVAALEDSLRRLRTDHVDLYWLHCWDRFTPIEETLRALDDLVRAGKVRYLGFSDTPAWKTAQAQTLAAFRGWAPLVALQVEYSLLERTVEGELVPMALELGLAITPWSPLRSGLLSGKYRRATRGHDQPGRGPGLLKQLDERFYALMDALEEVARELATTPARVALAWVQGRPGVVSTILGVRTVEQLEDDLGALALRLAPEHVARLDGLTEPTLDFPARFLRAVAPVGYGGTTIQGETFPTHPLAPGPSDLRW